MVYVVLFYCEEVVGVYTDLTIVSDFAKEKNEEAGYFLGDTGWPYTIMACELNTEDGVTEVDDIWMLKERVGDDKP
jgi:hypothetical protein